jgi:hypothetical protein
MQLNKILKGIEVLDINGSIDSEICDITLDSRKCSTGSLFIAAVGSKSDGHDYIESAIKAGASAVIYQEGEFKGGDATYIKVPDSRKAAGLAASRFYGNPSSKFNLVGVTGTNGKTTTATLLYHLFTSLGYYCGLISTIANYIGEEKFETEYTTPDAIALNVTLEEKTDDHNGNHGNQYQQNVPGLLIVFELKQTAEQFPYIFAKHDDSTQYSGCMHHHLKTQIMRFDAEKLLCDYQVTTAAYRQKLGQALDKTQNYRFKPTHCPPLSSLSSRGFFIIATMTITMPMITRRGEITKRLKLKISGLKTSGSEEPPPDIKI